MPATEARRLGWGMCAAGVVIMIAALLPWKTTGSIHVQGIVGDGILTIVFGFVGAVAGAVRALPKQRSRWPVAVPAIALTLATLTTLIAYSDVLSVSKIATVGVGLVLTLVGGIGLATFSVLALMRRT